MILLPSSPDMNNSRLGEIIRSIGENIEGRDGFWQFEFSGVRLVCITDDSHDRMRVMTPIASMDDVNSDLLVACMNANFDRALDARYCVNNEMLWGAFIHPLGSLTEGLFRSACYQVGEVAKNFGGSFSSGGLSFNTDIIE